MPKTAWPTTTEVTNRLTGWGVTSIPTGVTLQDEIDAAVEEFERLTRFDPFLANAGTSTRVFDPPGEHGDPYVFLFPGGAISVTTLKVGKTAGYAGTALTSGTHFFLERDAENEPYTRVRFAEPQYGPPQSLEIVYREGYAVNLPLDAWVAVLNRAASRVYSMAQASTGGIVRRLKQDSVEVEYAAAGGVAAETDGEFERVALRYQRAWI